MSQENSPATLPENVLLTGATRGLGLATARRLLNDGYRVIGVGRKLTPALEDLIQTAGPDRAQFVSYDLGHLEGIRELVNGVVQEHGPLYALVNNAGIGLDGVLATMHARDIEQVLRVNLQAPIHLIKYASRSMMRRRKGRIINVSSIIARTGFSGLGVYAASKAGLEGLTRSLSRELGRVGITVNCLAPGYMETEMTEGLQGEKLESVKRRAPLGLARPDDAAAAIAYLLSHDAERVTGTTLTVDGGSTA